MLWILLFVYQIKHFLADYPLQGKYMLGKFQKYPQFILPLLAHSLVHGVFTFAIAITLKDFKVAIVLAALDMVIHFIVDRIKASPDLLGRFKAITKADYELHMKELSFMENTLMRMGNSPDAADMKSKIEYAKSDWNQKMKSNTFFWWSLGWDQMMHHLTHYLIIWGLLP